MQLGYRAFIDHINSAEKIMINKAFDKIIRNFSFHQIFVNKENDLHIFDKINESSIIIVDNMEKYLVVCIDRELIIIQICNEKINESLIFKNLKKNVYFIKQESNDFIEIRSNFINNFQMKKVDNPLVKNFWKIIQKCMATFFIKKSFNKTYIDREFNDEKNGPKEFSNDEFIELRPIKGLVYLYYHIESERIFVLKKFTDMELLKSYYREFSNYKSINYPYLPKFYGYIKDENAIVIEFINGKTLFDSNLNELSINQKLSILFEILFTFWYLHQNGFIYRDLKQDNLILDHNNHIVLIDFEYMINIKKDIGGTFNLNSPFLAPEIQKGFYPSFKSDIFSIGKMIEFIFNKDAIIKNDEIFMDIINQCLNEIADKRPTISILFNKIRLYVMNSKFSSIFQNDVFIYKLINNLSLISNENSTDAQYILGTIYYDGKIAKQNIEESIRYFSLAADKNHSEAQYELGNIYYERKNINKALDYFTRAANQNNADAENMLGFIYYDGKYIQRNINKAIHYYTQAADQNNVEAQNNLATIYYLGQYIERNIDKAIHYFSLAAEQKSPYAQYNLGAIYGQGKFLDRDIKKSIDYFTKSANQIHLNQADAQFELGCLYASGRYIMKDLDKSINYLTLAAKQNHVKAHLNLGLIYFKKKFNKQDINKSIYYFTLASNQNN